MIEGLRKKERGKRKGEKGKRGVLMRNRVPHHALRVTIL